MKFPETHVYYDEHGTIDYICYVKTDGETVDITNLFSIIKVERIISVKDSAAIKMSFASVLIEHQYNEGG